jgi:chemotaxis regulatin CheY-phosphate phosphatase CheZ
MEKERIWSYKDLDIKEGLKPGSKHFQYFFVVTEKGKKKCNYCVWIDDENLARFGRSKKFEEIASTQKEEWSRWVQGKIDRGDFRNLVLKLEKTGPKEIDLAEMEKKLEVD